jgi:hypothetical protein
MTCNKRSNLCSSFDGKEVECKSTNNGVEGGIIIFYLIIFCFIEYLFIF